MRPTYVGEGTRWGAVQEQALRPNLSVALAEDDVYRLGAWENIDCRSPWLQLPRWPSWLARWLRRCWWSCGTSCVCHGFPSSSSPSFSSSRPLSTTLRCRPAVSTCCSLFAGCKQLRQPGFEPGSCRSWVGLFDHYTTSDALIAPRGPHNPGMSLGHCLGDCLARAAGREGFGACSSSP